MVTEKLWTHDAPCNACGCRARDHNQDGYLPGCPGYDPIHCQADGPHGGPVRVREDDAELCTRHEGERREVAP